MVCQMTDATDNKLMLTWVVVSTAIGIEYHCDTRSPQTAGNNPSAAIVCPMNGTPMAGIGVGQDNHPEQQLLYQPPEQQMAQERQGVSRFVP